MSKPINQGVTFGYKEPKKDPDNGVPGPGKYLTNDSSFKISQPSPVKKKKNYSERKLTNFESISPGPGAYNHFSSLQVSPTKERLNSNHSQSFSSSILQNKTMNKENSILSRQSLFQDRKQLGYTSPQNLSNKSLRYQKKYMQDKNLQNNDISMISPVNQSNISILSKLNTQSGQKKSKYDDYAKTIFSPIYSKHSPGPGAYNHDNSISSINNNTTLNNNKTSQQIKGVVFDKYSSRNDTDKLKEQQNYTKNVDFYTQPSDYMPLKAKGGCIGKSKGVSALDLELKEKQLIPGPNAYQKASSMSDLFTKQSHNQFTTIAQGKRQFNQSTKNSDPNLGPGKYNPQSALDKLQSQKFQYSFSTSKKNQNNKITDFVPGPQLYNINSKSYSDLSKGFSIGKESRPLYNEKQYYTEGKDVQLIIPPSDFDKYNNQSPLKKTKSNSKHSNKEGTKQIGSMVVTEQLMEKLYKQREQQYNVDKQQRLRDVYKKKCPHLTNDEIEKAIQNKIPLSQLEKTAHPEPGQYNLGSSIKVEQNPNFQKQIRNTEEFLQINYDSPGPKYSAPSSTDKLISIPKGFKGSKIFEPLNIEDPGVGNYNIQSSISQKYSQGLYLEKIEEIRQSKQKIKAMDQERRQEQKLQKQQSQILEHKKKILEKQKEEQFQEQQLQQKVQ